MLVDVVCPEGVAEGDLISIQHPETTQCYDVAIPAGVGPGVSFQVELPDVQQQVAIALPPEPLERRLPSIGPAVAVVAPLDAPASAGQSADGMLTPAVAEALHTIMEALFVYDELDTYINENAAAFSSYSPEGEQRLEWTSMHGQYVALVESRVLGKLRDLEVNEEDLYQLLGAVQGADSRADAFLARLITMGDYGYFCSQMALGGGALKVSGEDLRALSGNSRAALLAAAKHTFFSFGEGSHPKMEEFKVTAPDWAREGDSIEIEAKERRYIVTVPAGTAKGQAFNVAVPGLNQSAGELRAGLPCPLRVCCIGCSTVWLVAVWGVVAFSYLVLIFWREVRWNATTLVVAHALLGLQIASYVRCQVTPPGTVTKEWQHQAASGLVPSESCKRSGLLQPARGAFVSHEGKVVLALDHYCFWLGTTIGLRNRKYFLLFLLYSCALALLAGGHALHELLVGLPARLPASVVGVEGDVLWQRVLGREVLGREGAGPRVPMPLHVSHGTPLLLLQLVASSFGGASRARVGYCVAVMLVCAVDLVAAMLLGLFGGYHAWLVLRNRTTLAPNERRYDVGLVANVRQVMGRNAALWLLPIEGAGPTVDGIHWPLSPDADKHARAARDTAPPPPVRPGGRHWWEF